jgi:hypothetical protein
MKIKKSAELGMRVAYSRFESCIPIVAQWCFLSIKVNVFNLPLNK